MAEEQKDFPKYSPIDPIKIKKPETFSPKEEIDSYYNKIFIKWLGYFNIIDENLLDEISQTLVTSIKGTLQEFIRRSKIQIPDELIKIIDLKTFELYALYKNKQSDKFISFLIDIYSSLYTIKNYYKNFDLHKEYERLNALEKDLNIKIEFTKRKLEDANNTLALANLTGLASEFEYQYNKYNKERIFWLLVLVSVLLMISSKLFTIQFINSNFFILLSYISVFLFVLLSFNDDFLKNGITISTKINISHTKIRNITLILPIITFIVCYLTNNIHELKLFELSLSNNKLDSLQDFIPHLVIYIPMIWLLWFSIKQYHYTTKMKDAYRFKKALSLAYNGYKDECEKLFKTLKYSEKDPDKEREYKEYLLKEVLQVISDDPTKRDFKDTHMPWSEIKDVVRIFKNNK